MVYNVYFAARCSSTKQLSVGVATGPTPLGPFTATSAPLVGGTDMGYIGARASRGVPTLAWDVWECGPGRACLGLGIWARRDAGGGIGKPV